MKRRFYIADLHLQHRLVAKHRGFGENVDAHDASIARDWDGRVRDEDEVWVLGDLTVSARSLEYVLAWIAARPGIKHLVPGNHDGCHPMHRRWVRAAKQHLEVFETVQPLASVRIEGQQVMMSHFPRVGAGADHTHRPRYLEWRPRDSDLWLLHGHTHLADQRYHDRQLHVGWDAWRQLVSEQEVAKMIRENP